MKGRGSRDVQPMRMMIGSKRGRNGYWIQVQIETWNNIYEAYNPSYWENAKFFRKEDDAKKYMERHGYLQISIRREGE